MTKRTVSLCLLALMVCTLAVAQDEAAPRAALTAPKIVASGVFQHQSAPIPSMTIFTPASAGLYRVSLYLGSTSQQTPDIGWGAQIEDTDGPSDRPMAITAVTTIDPPSGQFASGLFSPKPDTPITFSVLLESTITPLGFYTVRYVVEQLQ